MGGDNISRETILSTLHKNFSRIKCTISVPTEVVSSLDKGFLYPTTKLFHHKSSYSF